MEPAGEIWSVVTLSPTLTKQRAPAIASRAGGSAVMPSHRGRGVYRALVARRLADARRDGAEAAVIQAVRSTSAPICVGLGFEEVCAQELWAWSPG